MPATKHIELPTYEGIVGDAAWTAEDALRKLLRLPEYKDERHGGYLTIMDAKTGVVVVTMRVGIVMPEKEEKYISFSIEKARRLYTTHKLDASIVTSIQTRDPDTNKWGGAVWSEYWIVSFSGLPELADEALSTCVAAGLENHPMPEVDAIAITRIAANPYTIPLMRDTLR